MKGKTATKYAIFGVIVLLITGIIIFALSIHGDKAKNTEDLKGFLAGLGYTVGENLPLTREVIIPVEFGSIYNDYNELQKSAGYDLWGYRGQKCTVYSFKVTNYADENGGYCDDIQADIMVCKGKIIGGDICSTRLSGFMTGLIKNPTL